MILTIFRSRHSALAGEDYETFFAELKELAKLNPGFVDIKSYRAEDGEQLTVVRWKDKETLQEWSRNVRHLEAKRLGREKWYDYFEIQTAEVFRTSTFDRSTTSNNSLLKAAPHEDPDSARPDEKQIYCIPRR